MNTESPSTVLAGLVLEELKKQGFVVVSREAAIRSLVRASLSHCPVGDVAEQAMRQALGGGA